MSEERGLAWRRHKDRVNAGKGQGSKDGIYGPPEKKWDQLYLRKEKLKRAQQLGIEYPRKSERQYLDQEIPLDECDE